MQSLPDDSIGHVGAIKVAGIDVVHAGGNGLPQNPDGGVHVARRPPDLRTGELHGAVAHTVHGDGCVREREGAAEIGLFRHCVYPLYG